MCNTCKSFKRTAFWYGFWNVLTLRYLTHPDEIRLQRKQLVKRWQQHILVDHDEWPN